MTRRLVIIGLAGLALAAALPAGASAAAAQGPTRIQSPDANQIVADGSVHVAVRSSSSLRTLRASVNGRDVERYFHHVAGGYSGTLRLGRGLQYGVNNLIVVTGDYRDFDHVSFVVARHAPRLLSLTSLRVDGPEAPVRVAVRAAPGSKLYAWINGHRHTRAFKPEGNRYVGRFGANDSLRPGRNRLVVRVARTHRSGRSAVHDTVERTFVIDRGALAASAGHDRVVPVGQPIVLRGDVDSVGGPESEERGIEYRWRIASDPPGPPASLRGSNSQTPVFLPRAPGRYRLRATTTLPDGTASVDTATAVVPADVPPIGWRLLTAFAPNGRIELNGAAVPRTDACTDPAQGGSCGLPFQTYAVWDRQTLDLKASGTFYSQPGDFGRLADIAATYKGAPGYLMVVNSVYTPSNDAGWTRLIDLLGVPRTSAARDTRNSGPISIIGVPGAPAGGSFVAAPFMQCGGPCPGTSLTAARQAGYVRLNPLTPAPGNFEFVYDDQVEFDTDASTVTNQIVIKVGSDSYTYNHPAGSSGFFHVRLDSRTLKPLVTNTFVTNAADGTPNPTDITRLAGVLAASADGLAQAKGATLVLLQAFGTPRGFSNDWTQAAAAVGRLGGTAQVFAWMNSGHRLSKYRGRYALVTRRAMDAPAAENSQSLTNTDGRLRGLLARGRDGQYLPLLADPAGTINFDLVRIVNRPTLTSPTPGGFPELSPGEQSAATALGRNVMNICAKPTTAIPDPPCDVRRAYWEKSAGTNWDTILTKLSTDPGRAQCEAPGPGFSPGECNAARTQLQREIAARNDVAEYFGTNGLQAPFGSVEVTALVDIAKLADEIRNAVKPADADNATAHALTLASYVTKLGSFSTAACPSCSAVASGLGATFALGAYLTKEDESPDLLGPQVSTTAVNLGKELVERYKNASNYFRTEAEIIMSDWSKLSEVADVVNSDPKWALGRVSTTTATIGLAAKQVIYQSMVTAAYPVLYDLGLSIGHATDWYCSSGASTRHLFGKTGPDAELILSYPNQSAAQAHVFAIGARKTVGTGSTAVIPSPPASVTDLLFRPTTDPAGDGLGFFKFSFYSPNNFSLFPTVLQQFRDRSGNLGQPCSSVPNPPGAG